MAVFDDLTDIENLFSTGGRSDFVAYKSDILSDLSFYKVVIIRDK